MSRDEQAAYQRQRTARKRQVRECFKCSNPVARGRSKTRCQRCLDRDKAKRDQRKALRLCMQCQDPLPNVYSGTLCVKCRSRYRSLKRALRARRDEEGLCTNCGKPKGVNTYLKHCFTCRKRYLTSNLWNAYKITAEISAPTTNRDNHIMDDLNSAILVLLVLISDCIATIR